jgi:hypothetical protein
MRVTDRLRRTGDAAAVAVVPGGTAAACSIAAVQPAVSPRPAPALTGAAAPPASGLTITRAGQRNTVPVTLGSLPGI